MKINYMFFNIILIMINFIFTEECGYNSNENSQYRCEYSGEDVSLPIQIILHFPINDHGLDTIPTIKSVLAGLNLFGLNNSDFYFYFNPEIRYYDDESISNCNNCNENILLDVDYNDTAFHLYKVFALTMNGQQINGSSYNNIVIFNNDNSTTIAHEIGHSLGLNHTHEGYEFKDENVNRDNFNSCYNCENTGDKFCDTPADPNLLARVNEDCNIDFIEYDSCGEQYRPNTRNILSYSKKDCRTFFSIEQKEEMFACISELYENALILPEEISEIKIVASSFTNVIEFPITTFEMKGIFPDGSTSKMIDTNEETEIYKDVNYVIIPPTSIQLNDEFYYHRSWGNENSHFLNYSFIQNLDELDSIIAHFDKKYNLLIEANYEDKILIKDPWHLNSLGEQKNLYIPLNDWLNTTIFLQNNNNPNYQIKVIPSFELNEQWYFFDGWEFDNEIINLESEDEFEKVFNLIIGGDALLAINYSPLFNLDDDEIIISQNMELALNPGTDLIFNEGQTLIVEGSLKFLGNHLNPIKLTFNNNSKINFINGQKLYFEYTEIINNSNFPIINIESSALEEIPKIKLNHVIFDSRNNNGIIDIGIDTDVNESCEFEIINSTFVNSVIGSFNVENIDFISANIKNNIFYESSLPQIFSGNICYNLFFNHEITDYGLTSCEGFNNFPSVIYQNPNFINIEIGNFKLKWPSPAIDAVPTDDSAYAPMDFDGTDLDLGYYYYNQQYGDINGDWEINVIDILIMVSHIIEIPEQTLLGLNLDGTMIVGSPFWAANLSSMENNINQDSIINVTDVLALINIILGNDSLVNNSTITYLSGIIEAIEDGQRYKYNIDMLNEQDVYILHFELQFDNKIPLNAIKGIRSDEMSVNYNIIADEYKINIMIFSPEGRKISAGFGTILEIELESTGLGKDGDLTDGSEFIITDLANNPETLIPVEIVSADELSRLAEIQISSLPTEYNLYSVYPNPFNPITNITYELPEESYITISIYDLTGRKLEDLVNGSVQAGRFNITWNAEKYASGVYIVKMLVHQRFSRGTTPNFTASQKIVLLK